MLFHIDLATDAEIVGWVLPDNPSSVPVVRIFLPGSAPIDLEANMSRPDLRDSGVHETGMAGFRINDRILPNFSTYVDQIEIRERDTNILIYRKFRPNQHLERKVFRFELQVMPDPQIEAVLKSHFALYYNFIHCYAEETFFGIIDNKTAKSLFVSGRPNFSKNEQWLREREFVTFSIIRNPFEEMAERLIVAQFASKQARHFLDDYLWGMAPLLEFTSRIRFDDPQTLRDAFANLSDEHKQLLSNPFVKTLVCRPEERPKGAHVQIALSKLAHLDVVGIRSRFQEFRLILAEVLGRDIFGTTELASTTWIPRVAETLSLIKQARNLVALDLELYSHVEQAVEDAIGPPSKTDGSIGQTVI